MADGEDDEFFGLIMEITGDMSHNRNNLITDIKMEVDDAMIANETYDSFEGLPGNYRSDQQLNRSGFVPSIMNFDKIGRIGMPGGISPDNNKSSTELLHDRIKIESVVGSYDCTEIQDVTVDRADGDVNTVNFKEDTLPGKQTEDAIECIQPVELLNVNEDQEINAAGDYEEWNSHNYGQLVDHQKHTIIEKVNQESLNNNGERITKRPIWVGLPEKQTNCKYRNAWTTFSQSNEDSNKNGKSTTEKRTFDLPGWPHVCNKCNKLFKTRSHLRKHMQIHTGDKPFKCSGCDYKCKSRHDLDKHVLIHKVLKPFQCSECDYKCRQRGSLTQHRLIHTGERPFKCAECDSTFRRKSHLTKHILIHTGEKPFKCVNCDHKCRSKSNLKNHMKIHTGEKPFQCTMCDFKCKRKPTLTNHMHIHSSKNVYSVQNVIILVEPSLF